MTVNKVPNLSEPFLELQNGADDRFGSHLSAVNQARSVHPSDSLTVCLLGPGLDRHWVGWSRCTINDSKVAERRLVCLISVQERSRHMWGGVVGRECAAVEAVPKARFSLSNAEPTGGSELRVTGLTAFVFGMSGARDALPAFASQCQGQRQVLFNK